MLIARTGIPAVTGIQAGDLMRLTSRAVRNGSNNHLLPRVTAWTVGHLRPQIVSVSLFADGLALAAKPQFPARAQRARQHFPWTEVILIFAATVLCMIGMLPGLISLCSRDMTGPSVIDKGASHPLYAGGRAIRVVEIR